MLILGNSVLEGVGTALLIPPVYILTTLRFDDLTSRARAFGVISGLGGIGAAAGPLIGGLITSGISWRAAFVFQAMVVTAIVLLSRRIADPIAPDPTRPFDSFGAVLSAVGMLFVVLGILQADSSGVLMAVFLVVGVAFLCWFFRYIRGRERAGREALLSTGLFKNRTSNLGLVTQNIQWLLLMGTSFVVAVFLQTVRGYNAIETGVVFTAATLGVLVSSLAAERLAKRRPQRTLIMAGFVVTVAGIGLLLALVGASSRAVAFAPGLLLIGLGLGVMLTPSVNVVQSSFPERLQGEISGLSRSVSNPRLVLRHRDRGDDPGVGSRLGKHVVCPGDGLPRNPCPHRARGCLPPSGNPRSRPQLRRACRPARARRGHRAQLGGSGQTASSSLRVSSP